MNGQTTAATLTGIIRDVNAAAVAGVTVRARNIGTGDTRTAVTSAEGLYLVTNLPGGTYEVTATRDGVTPTTHSEVRLAPGDTKRVDFAIAAAKTTSSAQVSTSEIEAVRARLRALDEERARIAQQLEELERVASTAAVATPASNPTAQGPARGDVDIGYLETVVVSGTRREASLAAVPAAVTVVGPEAIQDKQRGANLEESLRRVPGALLRDQLGGTSRVTISIRGAGATAADGARGVRLFVDGIPKNNAGGSAQDFINIDLSAAERIEVLRGPSSALYGNQAGGVVSVTSRSGGPRPAFEISQVLGSYGFSLTHLGGGGQASNGRFDFFGTAFKTVLDGFRVNSSNDNVGFTAKLGTAIDDRSTLLSVVMAYEHSTQRLPGELTAEEMAANPRQANPVAMAFGGTALAVEEFRFGGTYRRDFTAAQVEATGYYTPRSVPYLNIETLRLNQHFVNRGASGRLTVPKVFGMPARVTTGVDYQNTPLMTGSFGRANSPLAGQTLSELSEAATTVGPFALVDVPLGGRVSATAGVRFDHIVFSTENLLRPQDGRSDIVYEQFSPRAGVTLRLIQDVALYASYNEGFEAPILDQLRNSPSRDGEFVANRSVKPFDVHAFEVGARGQIRRLTFEASAYRQRINNLIVSQSFLRLPPLPGQFAAVVNAGKVDQNGLELGATLRPLPGMQLTGSYTYSDFTYRDFVTGGQSFSGHMVPGVPAHNVFAEVSYRTASGLTTAFDVQRVGRFFLNDLNTASNEAYLVANLRAGYDLPVARGFELSPWMALMNLGDSVYVAQTRPNAAGGRYFNPLPGLTFLAGVKFGY